MTRPLALFASLALVGLAACGGGGPARDPLLDAEPSFPGERESLQMYLVLTADRAAMQGPTAVDEMWAAVKGQRERYKPIHSRVSGVPGGYELDIELDFADLPHPMLDPAALAGMIADLPPEARAKAEAATLAVSMRSAAPAVPGGGQIRLVGAAAVFAAEQHDGVILDLLSRRAWTPADLFAELSAPTLSGRQIRLVRTVDEGEMELTTRGNPKYGAPDLQMRGVAPAEMGAARRRFLAVQDHLVQAGGAPGTRVPVAGETLTLTACEDLVVDVGCVQVPAP